MNQIVPELTLYSVANATIRIFLVLLLSSAASFAALTVTDRGVGSANTSQASTAMSPTSTIAAGSAGVLAIAADNASTGAATNFPLNITDSVGNSWHLYVDKSNTGAAGSVAEIAMYVCYKLTTQLTSGGNVTVTYTLGNVTAKAWTFSEIAPSAGNVALPVYQNSAVGGAVTTATVAFVGVGLGVGNVVIGAVGAESSDTFTGDADTTNGTWSTGQHTVAGSGATGMSIISQYKVQTTTTSTQSYDVTLTAADTAQGMILLKEVGDAVRAVQQAPNTSAASITVVPMRNLAAGSMGVVCAASKNAGASGTTKIWPNTATDSVGNVWTQRLTAIYNPSGVNTGAELSIYTAPIVTPLTTADSVTFTFDAGVSLLPKEECLMEFVPSGGNSFAYLSNATGTAATSAAPTVTTASLNTGDVAIGLVVAEGGDTYVADSDTSNGSWSQMAAVSGLVGDSTVVALGAQYKTVTGSGTQTYNPTLTSADVVIGAIAIRQSANAAATGLVLPNLPNIPSL